MEKTEISLRIQKAMGIAKHTQSDVFRETGVHQSQISRILKGDFERDSKNVIKLCVYANSILGDDLKILNVKELLIASIMELWDGSEKGAADLLGLFSAVKRLKLDKLR